MITIYRKSDLVCVGTVLSGMTADQEIELNVIPNFGGNNKDYGFIETDLRKFHLENQNGTIVAVEGKLSVDKLLIKIRQERDTKLTSCDWTQLPDAPATIDKQAWAIYRQQLRDFPATCDPNNPIFPIAPDGL